MALSIEEQMKHLMRACAEVISAEELEQKLKQSLKEKRPLKVKAGFDPSAPDIHLGHTVILRKLRTFQDLGHTVQLVIGDFTGQIGDPSGKKTLRKRLAKEEVLRNAETYQRQAFRILNEKQTEVVFNSSWCESMTFADVLNLTSKYTVARMLERDDFSNRFKENKPISIIEFLYPLVQGYDSVVLDSDIEIGGTDQKFNLLVGRYLQKEAGKDEPQLVMMMPILEGLDGVQKMSKSLDNYIAVEEAPEEMYGKVMSVSDTLMFRYYELLTDLPEEEIEGLKQEMHLNLIHPKDVKKKLARMIVAFYHGEKEAQHADAEFERVFKSRLLPTDMKEFSVAEEVLEEGRIGLVKLMVMTELVKTNGEARRLIQQGGVRIDSEKVADINALISSSQDCVLQAGKRGFVKIVFAKN